MSPTKADIAKAAKARAAAAATVTTPTAPVDGAATKIVKALEDAGDLKSADLAREAAGLPPRKLTPDEVFQHAVVELARGTGLAVGFNCASEEEAVHREALVKALVSTEGRPYKVRRKGTRLEVWRT